MALSPRLITLLGGLLGGSFGLAPLLSWKSSDTSTKLDETKSQDVSASVEPPVVLPVPADPVEVIEDPRIAAPQVTVKNENCTSKEIEEFGDLDNLLWGTLGISRIYYVAFNCDITGQNLNNQIPNNWTGLFPKKLIIDGEKYVKGNKLANIVVKQLSAGENSVTFAGDIFIHHTETGQWGEPKMSDEGKIVKTVNVTSSDSANPIYIVFERQSRDSD